ncbi:MAG: hypothetical protein KAS73_02410 [Candidatus Sabulitectum sp.]|nr:hypothetical protein [Candidatus Sabulitectum sp.]
MCKAIILLVCFVTVSFAGSDIPNLQDASYSPGISDQTGKPTKDEPSELSDSPGREESRREELTRSYHSAPQQELPLFTEMHLSISDLPDSDDSFHLAAPPHLLETGKKTRE